MAQLLAAAGFSVRAILDRAPDESGDYAEDTPQAYLLARRD
jgi:hypothetical protein